MAPTAPDSSAQGRVRETLGNNDTKPRALKGRHKCALSRPFRALYPNHEYPGSRGLDPGLTSGTPLACNPTCGCHKSELRPTRLRAASKKLSWRDDLRVVRNGARHLKNSPDDTEVVPPESPGGLFPSYPRSTYGFRLLLNQLAYLILNYIKLD